MCVVRHCGQVTGFKRTLATEKTSTAFFVPRRCDTRKAKLSVHFARVINWKINGCNVVNGFSIINDIVYPFRKRKYRPKNSS